MQLIHVNGTDIRVEGGGTPAVRVGGWTDASAWSFVRATLTESGQRSATPPRAAPAPTRSTAARATTS